MVESGDGVDADVEQLLQDLDRAETERAAAVDDDDISRRGRMAQDGVQAHGERIGQHRGVVADSLGHRNRHALVRG